VIKSLSPQYLTSPEYLPIKKFNDYAHPWHNAFWRDLMNFLENYLRETGKLAERDGMEARVDGII
jgi:hypothetical protein